MRLYETLVRRLYQVNLFHPMKLELTSIDQLHRVLGRPTDGIPAVHIAGTNGKGSVALKIARSLQLGGLRTGLFVSPHLSCFRERMQVNGELISEESVENLLPKIFELCEEEDIPASFFEITTALAFRHFKESEVDAMVMETGLGGRLDATNIITPSLSIITSVGLDHTRILGDSIEKIAWEKAGIIKPGVPVLVGESCPVQQLQGIAKERGSPFYRWMDVLPKGTPPPAADFDEENSRIAEAGLRLFLRENPRFRVAEDALREGTSQRPPCRFEMVKAVVEVPDGEAGKCSVVSLKTGGVLTDAGAEHGDAVPSSSAGAEAAAGERAGGGGGVCEVTVVLDVAHNPPAMERLVEKVQRELPGRRIRLVIALSRDKDAKNCLEMMMKIAPPSRIHLAEAATPRAASVASLEAIIGELTDGGYNVVNRARSRGDSVRQAVRDALAEAALSGKDEDGEGEVVIVFGTIFMMADARQELGFDEPQDSPWVAEVAGSHFRAAQDNPLRSGTHG